MERLELRTQYSHHNVNRNGIATLFFRFAFVQFPDAITAEATVGHNTYAAIKYAPDDATPEQTLKIGQGAIVRSIMDRDGEKVVQFSLPASELNVGIYELDKLREKDIRLILIDLAATSETTSSPSEEEDGEEENG